MTTEEFRAVLDEIEAQYQRWRHGELSGETMPRIHEAAVRARAKLDEESIENCR